MAGDNTVRLGARWLQIPPGPGGRSYTRARVEVRECLDGRLLTVYQARCLAVGPAPAGEDSLIPRGGPRPQRLRASQERVHAGGAPCRYLQEIGLLPPWPTSPPSPRASAAPRPPIPGALLLAPGRDSIKARN